MAQCSLPGRLPARARHPGGRSGRARYLRSPRVSRSGRIRCPTWRPRWFPGPRWRWCRTRRPASAQDWRASSGKTQLARYFAESLWRSPGVDVLTWVVASSRASVLSGFASAAAAIGAGDAGDAESVAARFTDWLSKTARPWLVVLDDLRDAADLRGLWPSGPAGRLLITTANPAVLSAEPGR